jgi:hypothetical protein
MSIIKITNAGITGTLVDSQIPNLATSKITSGTFADARIAASNVTQHATSFDDNDIINDLSTLGLRVHTQENLNASNTNSASFDVFQDSTGVTNLTNCIRNSDEYVSTVQTDPNTKILLTFESSVAGIEGADADSYSASIGGGSGTLNSSTKKYGSNSLQLSNDEYLSLIPATGDLFGDAYSGDFTIELWFYGIGGSGSYRTLFGKSDHATNVEDFRTYFNSTFGAVNFDTNVGGTDYYVNGVSTTNPTSQFNHYAFVRDGTNIRLYVNGVQGGSASVGSGTLDDDYSTIQFGRSYVGGNESKVSGYYDDIRLSNICRYPNGTSFTPPTEQLVYSINNATGSFEGAAITAESSTSSMGAVVTYQDNAGTNTLNTDIVLKLSADNGSNYSTATLTALPDFATGIKMCKVNDLSVTAGTQLKYKLEFANQASGSKEARIRGVSLQF